MQKFKDKEGLLRFVINLIIGTICFVILFYLLSSLLSVIFPFYSQQRMQAQGTIDDIYEKTSLLATEANKEILLYAPQGWHLMGFSKEKRGENKIALPPACNEQNCLCICQWGLTTKDCMKNAACKAFEKPFFKEGKDIDMRIAKTVIKVTGKSEFFDVEEIKG
jgi:hypothetical protein